MKYYKFIVKGNDRFGGVLYSPSAWPYPIARDAQPVQNWQSLVVELRQGQYRDFLACTGGANLVSKEMMTLLKTCSGNNENLEFLPVKAVSTEYGDRDYYIMHFKVIYDVIDTVKTIYVNGTDSILKLRLDEKKVKDLKVFNSQPAINDVIVAEDVCKLIKKQRLDLGLDFMPIYCGTEV